MYRRPVSRADTRLNSKSALFALIGLILSPLAVVHAATSPTDSVHFCGLFDYEQWRRDHPRPAGKALQDLNRGEERTVRMIYFLPNDRPYRAEVVQKMKDEIVRIQDFYAEQMQAHGNGNTMFRIETDAQGAPKVHRVDGRHPNSHYLQHDTADEVLEEIDPIFDIEANVYLIVIDTIDSILSNGREVGGVGRRTTKTGGFALVDGEVWFDTAAHELGHAFGLRHDFRGDTYIMSYEFLNSDQARLSACNAEFLAVHTYFNRNSSIATSESARPTRQSPYLYPPGSASVPIGLEVGGTRGLHQVLLFGTTREPHSAAGSREVLECRGFAGQKEAVARFEYDGRIPSSPFSSLSDLARHSLWVNVVDADGNVAVISFAVVEISPHRIATLAEHVNYVEKVTFSPDGTMLAFLAATATAAPDGGTLIPPQRRLELWDVASRTKIATLADDKVCSASFSLDGTMLATTSVSSPEIKLWDAASRTKIATLEEEGNTYNIHSVIFSPDGTMLASNGQSSDRSLEIKLWDVASRTKIAALEEEGSPVSFSPDGAMLAALSWNGPIKLWDVASRTKIATLEGAGPPVSFSPDWAMLATVGPHGTIKLWDVASRQDIATLEGHIAPVGSMAFSPDGAMLASGSKGLDFRGSVSLWDASDWGPGIPHSLTKVSGDDQKGSASTQLAKPLVVSVRNQDGSPVFGVRVAFSVTAGGGLLSSATNANSCTVESSASSIASYTDANGQASVRLTLGGEPGTNTVKATVEGLEPETFTATAAEQATPHRLTKVCGDSQEGLVDEQLAEPFVVSVSDENGAAIAGVAVSFAVTAGEGTLSSATATTNANGRAATSLTLGSEAGTNTVTATVEGLAPVTFTAIGEEDPLAGFFDLFGGGKRASLPDQTQLLQNAPNPFNSQTVLSYFLLEPSLTRLEVFSLTGQRVAVLHQGPQQAGYHRLHWDGRDAAGFSVASGAYLYRLVTDEEVLTRKLILLR